MGAHALRSPNRQRCFRFAGILLALALSLVVLAPAGVATVSPINGSLLGVAAISRSDAWAVGHQFDGTLGGFETLTEHWDGTSWSVVPSPNASSFTQGLSDVSAVSSADVWAVGWFYDEFGAERTLIEHWDGSTWSIVPSPDPTLEREDLVRLLGIDAISGTEAWAVGMFEVASSYPHPRTLIEHWDGSSWTVVPSKNPSRIDDELMDVSAASATDIWAVGEAGSDEATLIEHWDGSMWRVIPSETPLTGFVTLHAVSALPGGEAWAVGSSDGYDASSFIEHWDGSSWNVVPGPDPVAGASALSDVTAVASDDVWAVGDPDNGSGTLIEHWDGSSWAVVASPDLPTDRGGFNGVSALPGSAWAVGSYIDEVEPAEHPIIGSWNGAAWRLLGPHARVLNRASLRITRSVRSAHPGDRVVFVAHASNLDRHPVELWVEYRDLVNLRFRREVCVDGPSSDTPSCEYSSVAPGEDIVVKVAGVVGDGPRASLSFCVLRVDLPIKECKTGWIRIVT